MKHLLVLTVFAAIYGSIAMGVATTSKRTCSPKGGLGFVYEISVTSGGAPGSPVGFLTVTRHASGVPPISATVDLLEKTDEVGNQLSNDHASATYGSVRTELFTFGYVDAQTRRFANNGYISLYQRRSTDTTLLDIQLPVAVPNSRHLNTQVPLAGYFCVESVQ